LAGACPSTGANDSAARAVNLQNMQDLLRGAGKLLKCSADPGSGRLSVYVEDLVIWVTTPTT
jgi:hypothetical protein